MRFLIISCLIWFVGCASYSKKQNFQETSLTSKTYSNSFFSNSSKDYIYKASIAVLDKNFSGLLIIKKIDVNTHRIAFTTEMGNKLFDFTFTENDFQVNYILEEMNKRFLINTLKSDFKALIQERFSVVETYTKDSFHILETVIYNKTHYYYFDNNKLEKIIKIGRQKEAVCFLFSDINNNIANIININHQNFKLKISLKSI